MMKGIILELKNKYALVLTKEGDFKKIPIQSAFSHIGQEVQLLTKKQGAFSNHLKYAASFLIFVLLFTFYFTSQSQVYAYVTIDTNPSLELAINQHQKVLSISALNDDAKSIIKDIDYKNHTVIEVVQSIAALWIEKKYIKENNNQKFVITTISSHGNNIDIQRLNAAITAAAAEVIQDKALIISQNTTFQKRNQANKKQVSVGKILFEEKSDASPSSKSESNSKPEPKSPSKISNIPHKNQRENQQKKYSNKSQVSKKSPIDTAKKNKNYNKFNKFKK